MRVTMDDIRDSDMEVAVEQPNDKGENEPTPDTSQKDKDMLTVEDIREQLKLIERGVLQKESRYIIRAVRSIQKLRKHVNDNVLWKSISNLPPGTIRQSLLNYIEEPMDHGTSEQPIQHRSSRKTAVLPELETFLHLLIVVRTIDNENIDKAKICNTELIDKLIKYNRRSLDAICSRAYFYQSMIFELQGQLHVLRSFLHSRLRTATLHYDEESQAVLLNLLLRNYLHYNLCDQADKLVTKSTFPPSANNCETARFLFYLGRIKAIQTDYSESHKHLIQAIRKAPQRCAIGFRQTAHKFALVVELLLGEIPDRAIFREPPLRKPLLPYFQLTQAVRNGDLVQFNQVLEDHTWKFQQDHTYTLIIRLRHNVIKTGIRSISLSYSRISLRDIANKLGLDDTLDAEYIIAKAIKDGVIEAIINHEESYMQSKEHFDIYNTKEPQEAFHQRIHFCLDLYTQSIKAMRYPPKSYKDNENAEELRETEKQLIEVAKMVDDDEEEEEEEF